MNGSIVPLSSRLLGDTQYLAVYVPLHGIYIMARKQPVEGGSAFGYAQLRSEADYDALWADPTKAEYLETIETEANLAVLCNQFFDTPVNSDPMKVQVVNRAEVQKVFVVNATVANEGAMTTSPALTDEQLRAKAVDVKVTNYPASQAVTGDFYQATQPVSAASLPLPNGAATDSTLGQVVLGLQALLGQLQATLTVSASGAVQVTNFPDGFHVTVDNQPATQTVAGTVNIGNWPVKYWQDTQPVSGTVNIGNYPASQAVTGTFWQATQPVSGKFYQDTQPVSLASVPLAAGAATAQGQADELTQLTALNAKLAAPLTFTLPTGAATAGKQDTGNTSLSSIDTKLSLQATASKQDAANTLLASIDARLGGTLAVTFSAANPLAVTGPLTDTQLRAAPVPVTVANQPASYPVTGTFWQATQPVSLATNTPDVTDRAARLLGHVTVDNPVTSVSVSNQPSTYPVTGTFWQATQPISATALPLPTGAATSAKQDTMQASLDAVKTNTTGASTAALQTTGNTSLATIATNTTGVSTAAKQDAQAALQTTANGYLQTLATAGFTATVAPSASLAFSLVAAVGNNPTSVKGGAAQLHGLTVTNAATAYRYLMLYNSATAPSGTNPAAVITIGVPPNQSISLPIQGLKYINFSAGLALAMGTGPTLGTLVSGLLGTTGVTANDMVVNLTYS